jgi:predicted nuclease with TOPRIM domain
MNEMMDALFTVSLATLFGVCALWWYLARHAQRLEAIDRRVLVLEERAANVTDVRARIDALALNVAALDERSRAQTDTLNRIQKHLSEMKP